MIHLISGEEEVGIDGWNSMENCYAFLYSKEEKSKKKRVLVKCLVIGELLAIDVLDLEAQDKGPYNTQIKYVTILQLPFLDVLQLHLVCNLFSFTVSGDIDLLA